MFTKGKDLFGVHQKATKHSFSIDELLQLSKISRFLFHMESDALSPYIENNDVLVVDRAQKAKSGDYILASLNGDFLCRRLVKKNELEFLVSRHGSELIDLHDDLLVFGVVVSHVRKFY